MNIHAVRTCYDYHYWANKQILTAGSQVSPEQFIAPTTHSFGSLRGTLVHMLDSDCGWRMLCQHGSLAAFRALAEQAFPTIDVLTQQYNAEEQAMRAYLAGLSDADLVESVRYTVDNGQRRERILWHCLWHVVNHGTQHRTLIDHDNLEEFADPAAYDIEVNNAAGIAFYTALAQETGGPVLDIACGTGRVTLPIAQLGIPITGLDLVPGMLERARRKSVGLPIQWITGDARTFDLEERFKLIFLTGNAFQAFLTRADQEALLERVHAHLHDEGLFAFETRNPRWASHKILHQEAQWRNLGDPPTRRPLIANLETNLEEEAWPNTSDSAGREVRITRTQAYDHVAQILHWTTYRRWHVGAEEQTRIARTALRYTFPQELDALLHYNGFSVIRRYGDWDLEPLSADSKSIIVVCRKGIL